ncbi:MAG: hypothetical protein JRI68_02775 [Deltaproteobacteria bacterium]|nr:hypothetical protein [Deltaproteobacteria bacterium]
MRDTQPQASDQLFGRGISIQADRDTGAPANGAVVGSLIEDNHDIGVFLSGSPTTLTGVVVRNTHARPSDGLFGDGVAVLSSFAPGTSLIESCVADGNARAGLSNFGAEVTLGTTELLCNTLNLAGDPFAEHTFGFDDLGGNRCGCGDATEACKAATSGLSPPEPAVESP